MIGLLLFILVAYFVGFWNLVGLLLLLTIATMIITVLFGGE